MVSHKKKWPPKNPTNSLPKSKGTAALGMDNIFNMLRKYMLEETMIEQANKLATTGDEEKKNKNKNRNESHKKR